MAEFGYTQAATNAANIEGQLRGNRISVLQPGTVNAIWVLIGDEGAHPAKAGLYDTAGNLLSETPENSNLPPHTAPDWVRFALTTPYQVTSPTSLVASVVSSGGGFSCYIYESSNNFAGTSGNDEPGKLTSITYPTLPDPVTWDAGFDVTSHYSMYLEVALDADPATEATVIVDPDNAAGTDYTSLIAAVTGEARDLTASNERLRIQCRASAGSRDVSGNAFVAFDQFTADNYWRRVVVEAMPGHEAERTWNTSKYRWANTSSTSWHGLNKADGGIEFRNLQLEVEPTATAERVFSDPAGIRNRAGAEWMPYVVRGCYIRGRGVSNNVIYTGTNIWANNIFDNWDVGLDGYSNGSTTEGYLANNTFVNSVSYHWSRDEGYQMNRMLLANNVAQGVTASSNIYIFDSSVSAAYLDGNLTTDASEWSQHQNQTLAFDGVDSYGLAAGDTVARDNGVDLAAEWAGRPAYVAWPFTDDMEGRDRTASLSTWTIGALLADADVSGGGGGGDQSLSVADTGAGSEQLAMTVLLGAISDAGAGADAFTGGAIAASAATTDTATATDAIGGVSAFAALVDTATATDTPTVGVTLAVNDVAAAVDAVSLLQELLKQVTDTATGVDSVAGASIVVTVAESAAAADTVTVLQQALRQVTDAATGADAVTAPTVTVAVGDAATAADAPTITVTAAVADAGAGTEQALLSALVAVAEVAAASDSAEVPLLATTVTDTATGTEAVFRPTVHVTLQESASASDSLAAVSNVLAVLESAQATDAVVQFNTDSNIASITFTLSKRSVSWLLRQRSIKWDQ